MQDIELSAGQARKLALVSQGLAGPAPRRGPIGTLRVVETLGYVQVDTISVVARAHHHTLWNRVPGYLPKYLDTLVAQRQVLEYWAHAAAILPMRDYRFCLPRMQALASGQRHWYPRETKLMDEILARCRDSGELCASDFDGHEASAGMWNWSPVKRALERLFMEGKLLVTRRENFRKVFDLPERILPAHVDTRMPSDAEYAGYLVDGYLGAHGVAHPRDIGHLRKGMGPSIRAAITERLESGVLLRARIHGRGDALLLPVDFERRLARRLPRSRVRLLSPFDNLVIQRSRLRRLFGFDYQLECYVPEAKRRHGYFCLPVLWRGRLVARADCKADRHTREFHIHRLIAEPELTGFEAFARDATPALRDFALFNGCDAIRLHRAEPPVLADVLRRSLNPA